MLFARATLIPLVIAALSTCGCTGSTGGHSGEVDPVVMDLNEVADLIRSARKAPQKVADLKNGRSANPHGYDVVETGNIVVVWGGVMAGEGDVASGNTPIGIIAYEKNVPTAGGYVLLQNGEVKQLTADEFKSAPKAQ